MAEPTADSTFEIAVEPHNEEYDPDDERWRDQVATLYTALHTEVGAIQRGRPDAGAKGTIDQVIIALGSAGAFTAAVDCLRAWLERDRYRRVEVKWDENGQERSVTLTGGRVDVDAVRKLTQAVDRVGGPSWSAGTELS
jgi:hypothetical protein